MNKKLSEYLGISCPYCGSKLESETVNNKKVKYCPKCQRELEKKTWSPFISALIITVTNVLTQICFLHTAVDWMVVFKVYLLVVLVGYAVDFIMYGIMNKKRYK